MIFFSSDHHFFHNNVIRYCDRPYDSVEEMNEDLVKRWNSVVKPEDEVYYLGDFSLAFRAVEIFTHRLNGVKYLIPGNHDFCHTFHKKSRKPIGYANWSQKYRDNGWTVLPERDMRLKINEINFQLCHLPYAPKWEEKDKYARWRPIPAYDDEILLCGHVHEKWKTLDNMINVGCDVWDYTPVSINQILKELGGE